MAHPYDDNSDPIDFSHPIPLLPRHGVCVFPGTLEALHVADPRYVGSIERVLYQPRLIAVGTLNGVGKTKRTGGPGPGGPVCLARVAAHCPLADGSLNLMLRGRMRPGSSKRSPRAAPGTRWVRLTPVPDRAAPHDGHFDPEAMRRRLLIVFTG